MVNKRGKKALYEVMGRPGSETRPKAVYERFHRPESKDSAPKIKMPKAVVEKPGKWSGKPKLFQLNAGRLEISIPYQLGIALFLCLVLMLLVSFRLGQNVSVSKSADIKINNVKPAEQVRVDSKPVKMAAAEEKTVKTTPLAEPKGDHRIVIKQYRLRKDLEPVQAFFADYGIETVIENRNGIYFLVTKNGYQNPERAGTDGAAVKKSIIDVGAAYKAPAGYESFAPNLFGDAYGEKIN